MSDAMVLDVCRRFESVEAKCINEFLEAPTETNAVVAQAWPHHLRGRSIRDGLRAEHPEPVHEEHGGIFWMLEVCKPTQDPIALVFAKRLPDWQTADPANVRSLLARLLDLCTRFVEALVFVQLSLPAPREHTAVAWSFRRLNTGYLLTAFDREQGTPVRDVIVLRTATLEHRWQSDVDVRFPHPHGGWVRCVIPLSQLPDEANEGDRVEVQFTERADGSIACHAIPGSWRAERRTPTSRHEHLLPQTPGDWADAAAVDRYVAALRDVYGEQHAG